MWGRNGPVQLPCAELNLDVGTDEMACLLGEILKLNQTDLDVVWRITNIGLVI